MSTGQKPKILITGDFSYSRAQGAHVSLGLAKPLWEAGFSPEFLSGHMDDTGIRNDFQEFPCHYAPNRILLRGWRAAFRNRSQCGNHLLKWLEQIPAGQFFAVIADPGCGETIAFLWRLRRLCLAKAWRLVVVVAEWQKFLRSGVHALRSSLATVIDSEIQMRIVNKQIGHIIAVSTYLHRYYSKSGCNVIHIPPLIDTQAEKWRCRQPIESPKQDLTLLFSGTWYRDRVEIIIESVGRMRTEGHKLVLEFLGCGPHDLGRNPKLQRLISQSPPSTLRFHGWVPADRVLPIAASADFGLLLRDSARWSRACFPSKVAEFQALGVPLLCNLTSDLDQTLKDGENALIVPQVSVAELVNTIKRALALTPLERERMRWCSFQRAAVHFDYRRYVGPLAEFLNKV
jgi:glycosyltransferase involved in cell wall biosynthesis